MKRTAVNSWPTDFETGLPLVPFGEFTDFSQYPNSRHCATIRKLPVLRAAFDRRRFRLDRQLPAHVGWGFVPLRSTVAITLRIQRGADLVYWLANPSDARVWEVIDQWAAAGTMVLAAECEGDRAFIATRDFQVHPTFGALRAAVADHEYTRRFITDVSMSLANDELRFIATSDIPRYRTIRHIQACMVRTVHTSSVALALLEQAPGPLGPVADAVANLSRTMQGPTDSRH